MVRSLIHCLWLRHHGERDQVMWGPFRPWRGLVQRRIYAIDAPVCNISSEYCLLPMEPVIPLCPCIVRYCETVSAITQEVSEYAFMYDSKR